MSERTGTGVYRTTRAVPRIARILRLRCIALLVGLLGALATPGVGQTKGLENSGTGRISGRVVDAESFDPLEGVVVRLERADRPEAVRSTVTDSSGAYRFDRLRGGEYLLHVARIGYLARVLEVALTDGGIAPVAVGLVVEPVLLPPLEVSGDAPQPFTRDAEPAAEANGARIAAARETRELYLPTDVRQITRGEVIEAVTLGEPDLFRALQRTPGVNTRDDFTAMLWTRGATWDQTRVFLDGLPLYNPTHAGWLFSAINPDAIGAAPFFPGYRSARWGEGAAAVLGVETRRGGSGGAPFSGLGELSAASARLALDGLAVDGRVRWMIAGRRTYVDLLSRAAERLTGDDSLGIPYDFSDLVGRVDVRGPAGLEVGVSGIVEWDRLRGDVPGLLRGNRGRWGNRAGRVGAELPVGPVAVEVFGGGTRFGTRMLEEPPDTLADGEVTIPGLENSIDHDRVGVVLGPRDEGRWRLGFESVRERVTYTGPFSLLGVLITVIPRDSTEEPSTLDYRLAYDVAWGERTWRIGRRFALETGIRAEFGTPVVNGGALRFAPRLAGRVDVGGETAISAGWARSFQYTQDIAATAGPVGPQLHLSAVWALAQEDGSIPVARSDVATLGVERWFGSNWQGGATAYARRASGLMIPNPDPGAVTPSRDPDAVATNAARGLELSLRKLAGRWTGSLGYAYGDSRIRRTPGEDEPGADTLEFPSSADVRHAVDATGAVRVAEGWKVGGAFTYASGVPFTRLVLADTADSPLRTPRLEAPNAERTPSYASLDLMVEYTTTLGRWRVSGYGQLRNAVGRRNAVTYSGSVNCAAPEGVGVNTPWPRDLRCGEVSGMRDLFDRGVPRLPLIGLRVAF